MIVFKSMEDRWDNMKNIENFKEWLDENVKGYYNLDAFLEDLELSHGASGSTQYELGPFFTKDHLPKLYDYEVIYEEDEDGDWTVTYIL